MPTLVVTRLATLAAAAVLLLGAPGAAAAQFLEIGGGGGPSFPSQEFNDEGDTGYHAQGSVWIRPPTLPLGLRGDVVWQSFPDDLGGDFTQLAGFANATGELPGFVLSPYGLVGVGIVRHDAPDEEHASHTHAGGEDDDFGFQLGAGLRLGALGLDFFGEARYMDMGEDHAAVPFTFGILF